jgi:hypothetical protein
MAFLHEHDDDDEPGREYNDELLADISADERTADAPHNEEEEHIRFRRIKNAKHAKRRWNVEVRAWNPPHHRNLNDAFATADDRQYNMPIENIVEAALLIQRLPQNPETERLLHLMQRAIVQLDQQDPMLSLQRTRSRSERHESSTPRLVVPQEEDPTLEGMAAATATKTIRMATDSSTPSNPHAATLIKKSNSLHDSRATIRLQGPKPTVTPREATATVETSATCL